MVPNILFILAEALATEVHGNKLIMPEKYGHGYCTGYVFEHTRLLISNYELKKEIILNNPDIDTAKKMLFFKFQSPSVLIGTSRLNTDEVIEIHSHTNTINIEINAGYLSNLFDAQSPIVQSLLQNTQPLLFEQLIYPSLQQVIDEMLNVNNEFLLRLKSEELICKLLIALEQRKDKAIYPLNNQDIQTLYQIKDKMLTDLSSPPVINDLAKKANMSPTKLKRLFKQVFGNSIFNYYQEFRMKEAARLLKEKMQVSDVGYQLGFTNLSHFSKTFAAHTGQKPKQYSKSS